jgi:hypothetical protein
VKIDNVPAARPQAGLNQADVIFEELVEGGLSRFLAVYDSTPAETIGPVRSARPVDGALLRALNGGIFAYSGAAIGEIAPAKAYSTALLLSDDNDPRPFHRDKHRPAPSNLFTSTAALIAEAGRLSPTENAPGQLFTFGPLTPSATAASEASVHIGAFATATWTWNGQQWLRAQQGTPDILTDGAQASADNVLVLRVQVAHSGIIDAAGNEDPFVLAYGAGSAVLLRDGHVITGRWVRPRVDTPFQFTDGNGAGLTFTPGRTWVELVPTTGSINVN